MALPRKKTRQISVGKTSFRWGVYRHDDLLELRVELHEEPASQLVASFPRTVGARERTITPGLVSALIEAALDQGWKPESNRTKEFLLEEAEGLFPDDPVGDRRDLVCVVLTPFDAGAARVRDTIARTVRELGLQLRDPTDLSVATDIVGTITNWIHEADFVIADVTRQNPNVIYEVGYAHALGKKTILLVDGSLDSRVPDALTGYLYLAYDPKELTALKNSLSKTLLRSLKREAS